MIKRTVILSLAAGLVSGLLLFGGTAVMYLFSPVSAAEIPALVASQWGEASEARALPVENIDPGARLDSGSATPEASSSPNVASGVRTPQAILSPQPVSTTSIRTTSAVTVTVAQLLADPSTYYGQVVSTTGRVTRLSDEALLMNDGTGQVLVDLEDDAEHVTITDGATMTVVGRLDDSNSGRAFKIEAYLLWDDSGNVVGGRLDGSGRNDDGTDGLDDDRDDDRDDMDDDLDDDRDDINDDSDDMDDRDDDMDDVDTGTDDDRDDDRDDVTDDRGDDMDDDSDDDMDDDSDDDHDDGDDRDDHEDDDDHEEDDD